jgi:hypothetical protein
MTAECEWSAVAVWRPAIAKPEVFQSNAARDHVASFNLRNELHGFPRWLRTQLRFEFAAVGVGSISPLRPHHIINTPPCEAHAVYLPADHVSGNSFSKPRRDL